MNEQELSTTTPPAIVELRQQLEQRAREFQAALPGHLPPDRFIRVAVTAIQNNPDLLRVDRRSLLTAAMKAAQDGLLPDGREGALVIFRDRERGEIAQWLPMIAGLRKKARQTGLVATWEAHVVHQNDSFDYELGDEPFIRHRPAVGERGAPIGAYSICKLKSGEVSREFMSIAEITVIRARSRAKDSGPWVTDFSEMCRKTVARRHSKVLPTSNDLDEVLRRDDELYDLAALEPSVQSIQVAQARRSTNLKDRLDRLADRASPETASKSGEDLQTDVSEPPGDRSAAASAPAIRSSASQRTRLHPPRVLPPTGRARRQRD